MSNYHGDVIGSNSSINNVRNNENKSNIQTRSKVECYIRRMMSVKHDISNEAVVLIYLSKLGTVNL